MKIKYRVSVVALTMAVGMLGFWAVAKGWGASTGGPLHRLAADFDFDDETDTIRGVFPNSLGSVVGDDGRLVYQKMVSVPADHNVLYVTFSATGDTHNGAALWMGCRIDGVDCRPGGTGAAGSAPGYTSLQKMPSFPAGNATGALGTCNDGGGGFGDCHDNNLNYTWCVQLAPCESGTPMDHTVELRLATSQSGDRVFFEHANFYVDSNNITGNACQPFDTNSLDPEPTVVPSPAAPSVAPPPVTLPPLPKLP